MNIFFCDLLRTKVQLSFGIKKFFLRKLTIYNKIIMKIKIREIRQIIKSVIKESLSPSITNGLTCGKLTSGDTFKVVSPNPNDILIVKSAEDISQVYNRPWDKSYADQNWIKAMNKSGIPADTVIAYNYLIIMKAGSKTYDELAKAIKDGLLFKNDCNSFVVTNYIEFDKKYPQFKDSYELIIRLFHVPSITLDLSGFKGQIKKD